MFKGFSVFNNKLSGIFSGAVIGQFLWAWPIPYVCHMTIEPQFDTAYNQRQLPDREAWQACIFKTDDLHIRNRTLLTRHTLKHVA